MSVICVVGDLNDLTNVYVGWAARQAGLEVLELDEAHFGVTWGVAYDDERVVDGVLGVAGRELSLNDVVGVYARFTPQPDIPASLKLDATTQEALAAERRSAIEHLLNCLPCPVINRPRAGRSNGAKPYQMRQLRDAGFEIPPWLVTNDYEAARAFADRCHDGCIYKACSGLRSTVRRLDDQVMERLKAGTSPVLLQEYVPGYDVRVHTVCDESFATKVVFSGIDYRFDGGSSEFAATSAPAGLEALCQETARSDGLVVAGFDFRVSDDGRWWCLEMNPVPTFLPYEMATGQPIASAIVSAMRTAVAPGG
jgi:glutathione synthase/RimK-type ligase-like ATP-grasp enzyme